MSAKPTCPNYNNGRNQDEPETQHNRLSSKKRCNCKNCAKIPGRLECMCCNKIPEVKASQR